MKIESMAQAIERHGTQIVMARHYKVTKTHIQRWIAYGVLIIDGTPYKPVSGAFLNGFRPTPNTN